MQWWKLNHVLINLFIFGTNLFCDLESMDTKAQPVSTFLPNTALRSQEQLIHLDKRCLQKLEHKKLLEASNSSA